MIFPNVDLTTIEPMRRLHEERPDVTFMAMGLHPTEINEGWREDLEATREELESHSVDYIAIGEIGIDLYWDKKFAEQQMQALEQQMQWAAARKLPVIIHCREGLPQTLEVLSELGLTGGGRGGNTFAFADFIFALQIRIVAIT